MHEISIAQSIIRTVEAEAEKREFERVLRIRLRVGKFAAVLPDSLSFCFEILVEGTKLQDAELEIKTTEPVWRCAECESEADPASVPGACAACGGKLAMAGANDLVIEAFEVE